ncbi:LOW QUALITY PROTEIN: cytoplasmic dynein 2 intermediate chain 1 [Sceloporus undulatus]|uniref:LOW QUALITY PROTEIN: cytoplasmic dynein 2 intermediate chain 1 n=1 Tax=Sceloporus undulatus TaxID=8520 RepID=UPI001C4ABA50|nr:LOW QUALITY PROTEIN: cytoplasmic dynein 2 intermediate chain 1 [Sceloporus undulatus]
MEGDKRRTKDDTWKSDELKKHLKISRSDSQSEDRRHRQRKARDGDKNDTDDYKEGLQKDQDKERVKEKVRFKSSERHQDERREKGREKDYPGERVNEKIPVTHEKYTKKEKHITGNSRERHSGKERERKHKKDDRRQILMENAMAAYGKRSKEHYKRRESKDHADHPKIKGEERERRHTERKNEERKDSLGEVSANRYEEREHRHKAQKEQDPDKDRRQRHKEKKEHDFSAVEGKEKYLKLKNLISVKDGEESHISRKHKEQARHGGRHHSGNGESQQKEESEEKERDHKHSEHRSHRKSSRHEGDTGHPHERNTKEIIKKRDMSEREDVKRNHHRADDLSAMGPHHKRQAYEEEEEENEQKQGTAYPDTDYSVNYEDDFEDYEDDFDDVDDEDDEDNQEQEKEEREAEEKLKKINIAKNSEIAEIQKAINAENEKIETFLPKQRKKEFHPKQHEKKPKLEKQKSSAHIPMSGKFIDFQTAKQRQNIRKIATQQKKRSTELLRFIDLDFSVSFCLLDLPPVNEYDMYIRNFGKINTKQAYCQWNEDNLDRDVQTEEIETQEKWTQHPGETAIVCGGPKSSSDISAFTPKIDSQRLASFLRSACQVIEVLLEEDQVATQPRRNLRSRPSSLSISDRCFQLNTDLPFLNGRKISHLHISQAQRQALLSVHGLPEKSNDLLLDRKYIICVWNVWQPSSPQKLLFCESQVTCCCFSPSKAILAFAGTVDGSVLVWDLREDSRMHHSIKVNETNWTFRSPTFSTDGVFASINHTCPVLMIEPVSTSVFKEQNSGLSYLSSPEEILGLSFQIASMDENGSLSLWVVVELQKGDLAGSQSDLGLIPGGKIKLVHSSTVQLNCSFCPKDTMFMGVPQTLNIKFLPSNPNHFVVGTDVAIVSHGTRHELRVPPKWFKPQQGGARSTRVNAIDFSPFGKPIFLVGCSDGSIRLHQMTSELPLMQWNNSTTGQPIIALQWALTRPAVFFVLDATSVVYIWDLLENDLSPVAKQPIWSDKVITMAVLGEPEKPSGLLGIALAKESGTIDIKYVKKKWALPQPEESEKLNLLLQQAL